jgi:hypothetical protein
MMDKVQNKESSRICNIVAEDIQGRTRKILKMNLKGRHLTGRLQIKM